MKKIKSEASFGDANIMKVSDGETAYTGKKNIISNNAEILHCD
jgi:hypothetical protein